MESPEPMNRKVRRLWCFYAADAIRAGGYQGNLEVPPGNPLLQVLGLRRAQPGSALTAMLGVAVPLFLRPFG